jgi:hypothetical protein
MSSWNISAHFVPGTHGRFMGFWPALVKQKAMIHGNKRLSVASTQQCGERIAYPE